MSRPQPILTLPNSTHFSHLLQLCNSTSPLTPLHIHAQLLKTRFSSEPFILNRLLDSYAKHGLLSHARTLFTAMPLHLRNTYTYNCMIAAYTKSGFLEQATHLFRSIPHPDHCSWNTMVSGFSQHGCFQQSLTFFRTMLSINYIPGAHALSSALSACAGVMGFRTGMQIHALLEKLPLTVDVYMGSALVDMYAKCGMVDDACRVFDAMLVRNMVSWNSLITCYEHNGPVEEAMGLFVRMMGEGVGYDEMTLASVVSACASMAAIREGVQIHARVMKNDKFRDDMVLGNALVDMYAKCGRILIARRIFDRMPSRSMVSETSMITGYAKLANTKDARLMFRGMAERNIVAWNALIAGYAQNKENEEALGLFLMLKRESIWPSNYTFANILSVCANLANIQLGRQMHVHVLKHGFRFEDGPESDIFVGNSLVDMYLKCGSFDDGGMVFEKMVDRDRVSWNAMIVGYAQNGRGEEAIQMFRRMLVSGEKPDHATMIGVLSGCSHAGLVDEGRQYFQSMIKEYNLVPSRDHYTCVVDMLGRAGRLNEVEEFVKEMRVEPDSVLLGSLLASCRVHGNLKMGEQAVERLLELDPKNSGTYVQISNMYAEMGRWDDVARVRKLMKQRGVVKEPGYSWVEIAGKAHVFMVRDKRHPHRKETNTILNILKIHMKSSSVDDVLGVL